MFKHMRARSGWHDNIASRLFKHANGMFRDGTCLRAQACIETRLSATGLVGREVHVNAEAAENVHDGFTSLRVERIDETGDEKLNMRHESIVIHSRLPKSALKNLGMESSKDFGSLLKKFGMINLYEYIQNKTSQTIRSTQAH